MSITIERAIPADAAAMLEYLKQVGAETDNLSFGAEGLPFTVEAEAEYISGIQNSSDSIMLVAKDNGKIIGDASLSRLPRRMHHRGELGITVCKEYWAGGIGSQLMDNIIAFARENCFECIDLQVRSDNDRAIRLYEKYGFQKLCTHPTFFKIADEYVAFDIMYLPLK